MNSDFKADVRSLSISVELVPSGAAAAGTNAARQDYSMQNATTFPVNDSHAFLAAMKVLTAAHPAEAAWSLPWRDKLGFARTIVL